MSKSAEKMTNQEFLKSIMNSSNFGALSELFVIDALIKHSEAVSKADPSTAGNGFIPGSAWVGVAKEISQKLSTKYGVKS
jgi:hypothetical protein